MKLRITITRIYILIILFTYTVHAQNNIELNVITIDLEKENLIGMRDVELKNLLNNKIENDWNIIMNTFNRGFQIPVRIMIYKDGSLIYMSMCFNKKTLFNEINVIVHLLDLF